jgi:hypothetical protein
MAEQSPLQDVKNTGNANPLAAYFRQPKIYIRLPSEGKFYADGSLDVSQNGEYAVYAMTAKDELMFKTPDALMNGQSTVEVIKSCVPAIKDPWKMPSIDIDATLIAIRVATYGEKMGVSATCPSCKHDNEYDLNLVRYLDGYQGFVYTDHLSIGPLTIFIKPYSYRETTKIALKTLEQQKIFSIVNDENLKDDEKIEKFGESFIKLTELTVDVIADSVIKVETPEGSVTDKKMIMEFVRNAPKDVFDQINEHVLKMKQQIELKVNDVQCGECEHVFDMPITMDQSSFFAKGS